MLHDDINASNLQADTMRESLKALRERHDMQHGLQNAKNKFIEKEHALMDKFKGGRRNDEALDKFHQHKKDLGEKHNYNNVRNRHHDQHHHDQHHPKEAFHEEVRDNKSLIFENNDEKEVGGFMVLGMHRSGTSMLAGLLVEGFGYNPGAPLIQPAYDNEKGFYELIPAVLQNDIFMSDQHVDWASHVKEYDAEKAIQRYKAGQIKFERGTNALRFLNNKSSRPWLQKDPRMCITMRTWLPLLNTKPAVIFTYRHPLEVAMSLANRQHFKLAYGLRLWIQYNKYAVLNSADLCRVLSSNNAVLSDPLNETKRIASELTTNCNVPAPPKMIDQTIVESFVDTKLQHNKNQLKKKASEKILLESHGDCLVKDFDSSEVDGSDAQKREMNLYLMAMKIYCDFESGKAYEKTYEWPDF